MRKRPSLLSMWPEPAYRQEFAEKGWAVAQGSVAAENGDMEPFFGVSPTILI